MSMDLFYVMNKMRTRTSLENVEESFQSADTSLDQAIPLISPLVSSALFVQTNYHEIYQCARQLPQDTCPLVITVPSFERSCRV